VPNTATPTYTPPSEHPELPVAPTIAALTQSSTTTPVLPQPYAYGYGTTGVVVEDCVSAAIVGETNAYGCSEGGVYVGVAVLGTSLSEVHKQYLSQFSTVIIALDPDALPKTLQFAKELRGYVHDVKVLRLTDDLKYRNPTDIENLTTLGEV